MLDQSPKGTMRIYAPGGGGINIARFYNHAEPAKGLANIATTLADTSTSNFEDKDPTSARFQFQGAKDGSGKERAVNADAIQRDIPRLLNEHPPGDLNVVVHTGSGGTGSVAGYLITKALMERGLNTVVVLIGTSESGTAAMNTFKTFKSYDALTIALQKSIVVAYVDHPTGARRADVDKQARKIIGCLSYLCSRENREFDTMDLTNFLNFTRNSLKVPSLGLMRLHFDHEELARTERNVLTMASLYLSPDDPKPNVFAPDSWDGYYRDGVEGATNFSLVISTSGLSEILQSLEEHGRKVDQLNQSALQGVRFAVSDTDNVSSSGLVL